jgi:hypothetical protein
MEDKIRKLCQLAVEKKDPAKAYSTTVFASASLLQKAGQGRFWNRNNIHN